MAYIPISEVRGFTPCWIKDTFEWGYFEFKFPEFQCVEIIYTADGENIWGPDMFESFPGNQERIQRRRGGDYEDYIRDILPAEIALDYYALLETYLEYYGFITLCYVSPFPQ